MQILIQEVWSRTRGPRSAFLTCFRVMLLLLLAQGVRSLV